MVNVLDVMEDTMSMYNLDIAVDLLKQVINNRGNRGKRDKDFVNRIKDLTELVSNAVWDEQTSDRRVEKTIIPLLRKAYSQLNGEESYEGQVKKLVGWRISNLVRYVFNLSPADLCA